ncbi:hypothetical protein ACFVTC_35260 [Streptomyces sp. NPDC057950]|uniref:hypothetical protein n=1 Tax=Streptomyces sp. NPDC057950 TaxID=3346288 RepID=UPI0036F04BD9
MPSSVRTRDAAPVATAVVRPGRAAPGAAEGGSTARAAGTDGPSRPNDHIARCPMAPHEGHDGKTRERSAWCPVALLIGGAGLAARGFREARRDVARVAPAGSPDERAGETPARTGSGPYFIGDIGDDPTPGGARHAV